jgi:hypothetical protein
VSPDTEQAIRMLDSLGARYFELTVNDLKGEKMATARSASHKHFCLRAKYHGARTCQKVAPRASPFRPSGGFDGLRPERAALEIITMAKATK